MNNLLRKKGDKRNEKKVTRKKKLLLINPVNQLQVGLEDSPSALFPPLGLGIIATLTPDEYEVKLIDENFDTFSYEPADLVGLTAYTLSSNRAYEIASIYKKKNIPVIMGGIHVSMRTDEALQFVDTVVIGEAESIWGTVIDDFNKGQLKRTYTGIHLELVNTPIAKRDIFSHKYLHSSIQTSRGCPMDCKFCTVTAFNNKEFRQRPIKEVLDEFETIQEEYLFILDDNLVGYGKKSEQRTIELFKGMVERKIKKKWYCMASLNFGLNEELLKWAAKSGCKMVFLGIESQDPAELRSMNKKINLSVDYQKVFKNINRYGIAVFGAFICGFDNETDTSLMAKTNYILKNRIDVMEITVCTPFPGTKLYDELQDEDRLFYTDYPTDWDRYNQTVLTFQLNNMNQQQFHASINKHARNLYSEWNIKIKALKTFVNTGNLETAIMSHLANNSYKKAALSSITKIQSLDT